MKKLKLLLLSLLLVFTSCNSNQDFTGSYKFQLGADKGTHFGIELILSDEVYPEKETEKKWELVFDMNFNNQNQDTSEEDIISTLVKLLDEDGDGKISIVGYYSIGDDVNDGGKQLNLSIVLIEDTKLDDVFKEYLADIGIEATSIVIPDTITDLILYSTVYSDRVSILIPVSFDDLCFQLYWYGYRLLCNDDGKIIQDITLENPLYPHHELGTHPSKDDVKAIKAYEVSREHEDNKYENYRDYYVLDMGLNKQ